MPETVILDTNVLISALGWAGPEARVLHLVLNGNLDLATCPQLIDEFLRVTRYPKFRFSGSEIDGFLGRLLQHARVVRPSGVVKVIEEDPDDNIVLACVLTAGAGFIITGDAHLLNLENFEGIRIQKAADFLRLLSFPTLDGGRETGL